MGEIDKVSQRYARRAETSVELRYSMLKPEIWQTVQERQRVLIALLAAKCNKNIDQVKVLEVGCGSGGNLLELIRLGFSPENLVGNELLPERATIARKNLPTACQVLQGDATELDFAPNDFDIVYQSTVFTSLLDDEFQDRLAQKMFEWVNPGGGVLWYDFMFNNPSNPDVRGVPLTRIKALFPYGEFTIKRITLAPPISRRVCSLHPSLYHLFNAIPFFRTHVLCFIGKPI